MAGVTTLPIKIQKIESFLDGGITPAFTVIAIKICNFYNNMNKFLNINYVFIL